MSPRWSCGSGGDRYWSGQGRREAHWGGRWFPATVTFEGHLEPGIAEETLARTAADWHVCLDVLALVSGGETPASPHTGPTPEWHERYAAYVERGFPSGAPIPETVA